MPNVGSSLVPFPDEVPGDATTTHCASAQLSFEGKSCFPLTCSLGPEVTESSLVSLSLLFASGRSMWLHEQGCGKKIIFILQHPGMTNRRYVGQEHHGCNADLQQLPAFPPIFSGLVFLQFSLLSSPVISKSVPAADGCVLSFFASLADLLQNDLTLESVTIIHHSLLGFHPMFLLLLLVALSRPQGLGAQS